MNTAIFFSIIDVFVEQKNAAVSKKEHVITIKGCVVLYQKVAFKTGKD